MNKLHLPRAPEMWTGLLITLGVLGVYYIGAGRAYGLDESVTVRNFVSTGSLLDSLDHQVVYNNQVLFSFSDHVVYSLTGTQSEYVLRFLPIVASALGVGIIAVVATQLWGWAAGLAGAGFLTFSPVLFQTGREVRGYSLLMVACVVSTVLFTTIRSSRRLEGRGMVTGYVLALGVGIGAHLYGLAMLVLHPAIVGTDKRELRRWLPRWLLGAALGLLCWAGVASAMIHADRSRIFQPSFPITLVKALLGGTWPIAALIIIPLIYGVLTLRSNPWFIRAAGAVCLIVLAAWIIAPQDLYTRFFIWLLPAAAVIVAAGVARHRALTLLVGAFVLVEVLRLGPQMNRDDLANRAAARIAVRSRARGQTPCALGGLTADSLEAYYAPIKVVGSSSQPPACSVVFQLTPGPSSNDLVVPAGWRSAFPYRSFPEPGNRGVAFSRQPLH